MWSTDDGGRHWRRIYPRYATRVLRMSKTTGLISVGSPAPACGCATRQLWTRNGGKSWRSAVIGQSYTASGAAVYWWTDNALFLAAPNLRSSTRIALTDGTIVAGTPVAGGMAALVDRRDKAPQVIVAQGTSTRPVTLPAGPQNAVVRTIRGAGGDLVVRGTSVPASSADQARVEWTSKDGGQTWSAPS